MAWFAREKGTVDNPGAHSEIPGGGLNCGSDPHGVRTAEFGGS